MVREVVRAREKSGRITFKTASGGDDRVRRSDKVDSQGTKETVGSSWRNGESREERLDGFGKGAGMCED